MRSQAPGFLHTRLQTYSLCALALVAALFSACRPPDTEIFVVKVGLVAPFEGSFRDIGYDAIYGARLAVREINESRSAGGWRLELIAYDDRGDPEIAVQAARNLVADPAVVAVMGHYRPETTEAAAPIYAAAGLPFITLGGWGAPSATTWYLMPSFETLLNAMRDLGEPDLDAPPVVWATHIAEDGPAPLPDTEDAEATEPQPALVLSLLPPIPAGERLSRWRREGWTGQVVGDLNFAASAFAKLVGPGITDTTFVTPYPFPLDLPDSHDWVVAYRALGPYVPSPGIYALPTYEATYLVAESLEAGRERQSGGRRQRDIAARTREELALALAQVTRIGWLGQISWNEDHTWSRALLYIYRWTEQGVELVDSFEPAREVQP